jgi:integrase
MARPSSLWQRKQNGFWYTKLNRKQVKLSKDKGEARRLLHKLLAADAPATSSGVSCRRLLDTYLARTVAGKSPGRLVLLTRYLKRFCETFGHRRADAVRPYEISEWLEAMGSTKTGRPLSASTKALVVSMLRAGFNFAVRQGYVPASPMKGVAKGKFARRERMLTPGELDKVAAESPHRDFLTVLRLTGMRPFAECATLTAAHLDRGKRRAVLVKHKTAEKTGRPRVVYFPPAAWEVVSRLAERHPTGLLFRNRVGAPLTCDALNKHLREVCGRVGVKPFTAYSLRHFFLSTALGKGVPIDVLAQIAGNSPLVLRSNYSHMEADAMAGVMAEAAAKAVS